MYLVVMNPNALRREDACVLRYMCFENEGMLFVVYIIQFAH